MGIGMIPFGAIDRYADRYEIATGDDFEEFHRLIRAMDRAFMEQVNSKRKKETT